MKSNNSLYPRERSIDLKASERWSQAQKTSVFICTEGTPATCVPVVHKTKNKQRKVPRISLMDKSMVPGNRLEKQRCPHFRTFVLLCRVKYVKVIAFVFGKYHSVKLTYDDVL